MLIDLKTDPHWGGWADVADICIVGAGAAGITLVRRLMGRGRKIVLLESGGMDYEPDIAALNAGRSSGMPYYDLEDARLRLFGGTAAIWGGRCAELDEIDFEPRDWVHHSGWPFRKTALAPYYDEARRHLQLESRTPDDRTLRELGVHPSLFGEGVLTPAIWQFDDCWDRFGLAANADVHRHPDVTVLLHASVTELNLNESGSAVESVDVAQLAGDRGVFRGRVRARVFVLAAGGLENPRLLLASRSRSPHGVGNQHDVVGRYFMEHPHARGGQLHIDRLWDVLRAFGSSHSIGGMRHAACLRPADGLQREHRILNSSFVPRVRAHPQARSSVSTRLYQSLKDRTAPTHSNRMLWRMTRSAKRWLHRVHDPLKPWLNVRLERQGLYLSMRAEQAPNPDSRVRITRDRDALGVPRIELDWRLSEIDKRTLRVLVCELDAQLRRQGTGSVEPAPWLLAPDASWENDPLISHHPIGGYHHMGTTRMAVDARRGVVDAHCRVHGVANLFIAGSSVFPTSGWANPTLTILALCLRLGDYLQDALGRLPLAEQGIAAPTAESSAV
ncbi:MAG: FAD-dependent oxidoreductase [Panacagrimonas sp.]